VNKERGSGSDCWCDGDEMRASREEKGRYLDERARIMVRWNSHVGNR